MFVDSKFVFDSIFKQKILNNFKVLEVSQKLKELLKRAIANTKIKVKFQEIRSGEVQKSRDPISTTLFHRIENIFTGGWSNTGANSRQVSNRKISHWMKGKCIGNNSE